MRDEDAGKAQLPLQPLQLLHDCPAGYAG
jgi:hypothetical protein